MNWPAPGNDPMYLYNPTQANDRRNYYGVNSVPHVIMDGVVNPSYPYSDATSLPGAFYPRKNVGTPIAMSVIDTRIANGDSVRADITVQVLSPLNPGNYYLRVMQLRDILNMQLHRAQMVKKIFMMCSEKHIQIH